MRRISPKRSREGRSGREVRRLREKAPDCVLRLLHYLLPEAASARRYLLELRPAPPDPRARRVQTVPRRVLPQRVPLNPLASDGQDTPQRPSSAEQPAKQDHHRTPSKHDREDRSDQTNERDQPANGRNTRERATLVVPESDVRPSAWRSCTGQRRTAATPSRSHTIGFTRSRCFSLTWSSDSPKYRTSVSAMIGRYSLRRMPRSNPAASRAVR